MSLEQVPSFDQLLTLMGYVLSGDNVKIQEATKVLKVFTKKLESVAPLAQILSENPSAQLRQLSAILLKRHIITLYLQLQNQFQIELKALLLKRFFAEETNVIRTNIGQIIGIIAQQVLIDNNWPELYNILQQQTQKGQDIVYRQRGLILLSLIFDYSGDALKPFYASFFPFFAENLNDPDKLIRSQTVRCLISLFDNIQYMDKKEAQQYRTLVQPILQFVDQSLQEGDEDNAYHCFDAFNYLAESKLSILDSNLGQIIQYAAGPNILLNPKCSHKFKECVIDFIYTVVESQKKVLTKNVPLLKQLIESVCLLIAQPINTTDYEEDEEPIQDIALWLIEVLAISLPKKKQLYIILLESITSLIQSNDVNLMNAGFLILAAITEGLQDQVRKNLSNPIMNSLIPRGLEDVRAEVRGATIKAITYFSEFLCPDILSYDNIIIPYMIKNLVEADTRVREKGLIAIDIFSENMEEDAINKYLGQLVPTLGQLFINPSSNLKSKRLCLSSLGSIITSSRNNFSPYLSDVSSLLIQVLNERDTPEILGIKAEAITCLGKIAEAFPQNNQVQQQLISGLAAQVYQLLISHQDYEIRESCLSFFYNQASAQKEQFAPVFTQIIEFTIQLAQSQEGVSYDKKKKEEFSLDTDSDDDEDAQYTSNNANMKVKVTQLDEKAAAIHALGQFAIAVPQCFGPYFKRVTDILEETINYFYENVRIQSIHCYRDLIEGLVKFSNNGQLPIPTYGLPCVQRLNQEAEAYINNDLMIKLLTVLVEDEASDAVVVALDAIEQLLKKIGPCVIDQNLTRLTKNVVLLLEKKTRCFGNEDGLEADDNFEEENNENDDEEEDDTNETVFEAITDLIPQMAKTLKLGFIIPYQSILPSLFKYCNEDKENNDILQTIGCFAEIFSAEPNTITTTYSQILPKLLNITNMSDLELNRNAAYCLGNFIEFGQVELVKPYLQNILQTLQVIYDGSGHYQAAVDNAAAALCKIIVKYPEFVPVQAALQNILKLLPFKGDEQEEFTAVKMLLHLGNTQPDLINMNIDVVIQILLDAILNQDKYKIKGDKLQTVINAVKSLAVNQNYKQIIQQNVIGIADEQLRNQLISALQ